MSGTKPWEEAAGATVMAVRAPGFSPFTGLLNEENTKNKVTLKESIHSYIYIYTHTYIRIRIHVQQHS